MNTKTPALYSTQRLGHCSSTPVSENVSLEAERVPSARLRLLNPAHGSDAKHCQAERARQLISFPAFFKVEDRTILVIGGGDAAAAKVRLLTETRAQIAVVSETVSHPMETALRTLGEQAQYFARPVTDADIANATLVFVATGEAETDGVLADRVRALNVPVNVVDRPDLCDFYTPALINRAPLGIAICSNGSAPVLSRKIRSQIEALLPPTLGRLAEFADGLRETLAQRVNSSLQRRRFWQSFFDGPIVDLVLTGKTPKARVQAFAAILEAGEATTEGDIKPQRATGYVSLVGAGPGSTDLLTLRAQRMLQQADVIIYDRLVPADIVAMGRRDADRIYVGKAKGAAAASQSEINALLVKHANSGHRVVRLKSGDPLIFGRAGEEMEALDAAGVSYDVVPGVTAAFAAAAAARIPLTHRETASSLVFATGHAADGRTLPDWADLALKGATVAVYMGRTVAGEIADLLVEAGLEENTPVAVIENASRSTQRVFAGSISELGALSNRSDVNGPALIIIGATAQQATLRLDAGEFETLIPQTNDQEGPLAVVAA